MLRYILAITATIPLVVIGIMADKAFPWTWSFHGWVFMSGWLSGQLYQFIMNWKRRAE